MHTHRVYLLGGAQTDFSRNWAREGLGIYDMFRETTLQGLQQTALDPADIAVGHVGNFVAELFAGQGQLGGFFGHVDSAMAGMPACRHEAACASGSMAILAAMADIESGRYPLACVLGIELMRNIPGDDAAENLRPAGWNGREAEHTPFVWPHLFSDLVDEYEERYGIDQRHLSEIARINFANAKRNPNAQSRKWQFSDDSFSDNDAANPQIIGRIRRHDCGQISDGAAVVFLASEDRAADYAKQRGIPLEDIPYIKGWSHRTAPMLASQKIVDSAGQPYVYPHVRQAFLDAYQRAGIDGIHGVDGLETHDCFTITEYMAIEHSGLTAPGEAWRAIEEGVIAADGALPINASGGLIGLGHPVGATGVRMALDCYKQVTGTAGDYQIDGARNMLTYNVGGSATTSACLVIGK
jgi:acetyl-CoA C-acetyltransferase